MYINFAVRQIGASDSVLRFHCREANLFDQFLIFTAVGFLHPIEEPSTGMILELYQEHTSSGTLRYRNKVSFSWEDDKILGEEEREGERRGKGDGNGGRKREKEGEMRDRQKGRKRERKQGRRREKGE